MLTDTGLLDSTPEGPHVLPLEICHYRKICLETRQSVTHTEAVGHDATCSDWNTFSH
jgi:hypothetical protein